MDLLNYASSSEDEGDTDVVMTAASNDKEPPHNPKRPHDKIMQGPAPTSTITTSNNPPKRRRVAKKATVLSFAPPQVSGKRRSNVSTEDLDKWNSKQTNLQRNKREK
jgi:hypothetical protein